MSMATLTEYQELLARRGGLGDEAFEDELSRLLTPDAECIEAESLQWGGTWRGPAGFVAMFDQGARVFADLIARHGGAAGMKAHDAVYTRCDNGDILRSYVLSLTAKGRGYDARCLELYRFEGDRIALIDVFFFDTAAMLELLSVD